MNYMFYMHARCPNLIELEPRLKSAKTRFQLSAGVNLETLNTILSGMFEPHLKFKPRHNFFKFGLLCFFFLFVENYKYVKYKPYR